MKHCTDDDCLECEFESMAGDPAVWRDVEAFLTPPRRLGEASAARRAVEMENAQAARRIAPLLKSPLRFLDADVAADPAFQTPGAVRMLCAEAHSLLDRWPKFSAALAAAAAEIAKKLEAPVASRRFLLAMALRERANALRYLGSFLEALEALAKAETLFRAGDPSLAPFELAIVFYIRGTVLVQLDDTTADALAISLRAVETFHAYGDQSREMSARLLNGLALLHLRRPAEALTAFEQLIADARHVDHKSMMAHGFKNAALASADLHDLENAERHFADALAIYDELGMTIEQARVVWALASIPVARGRLEEGATALEAARRDLLLLGLKDDHGLATLEWAEVCLALGRSDGVQQACRQIMLVFESEGMMQKARLALAYVHEALARQRATPALLRSVRTYLAQLPRRPDISFTPPA